MKLRIKDNSIRLRLNREEVERFAAEGLVESTISFGAEPADRLTYALRASESAHELAARYDHGNLTILIPQAWARAWHETDRVGFESNRGPGAPHILVEKDFACLHRDEEEEDLHAYPHPASQA